MENAIIIFDEVKQSHAFGTCSPFPHNMKAHNIMQRSRDAAGCTVSLVQLEDLVDNLEYVQSQKTSHILGFVQSFMESMQGLFTEMEDAVPFKTQQTSSGRMASQILRQCGIIHEPSSGGDSPWKQLQTSVNDVCNNRNNNGSKENYDQTPHTKVLSGKSQKTLQSVFQAISFIVGTDWENVNDFVMALTITDPKDLLRSHDMSKPHRYELTIWCMNAAVALSGTVLNSS